MREARLKAREIARHNLLAETRKEALTFSAKAFEKRMLPKPPPSTNEGGAAVVRRPVGKNKKKQRARGGGNGKGGGGGGAGATAEASRHFDYEDEEEAVEDLCFELAVAKHETLATPLWVCPNPKCGSSFPTEQHYLLHGPWLRGAHIPALSKPSSTTLPSSSPSSSSSSSSSSSASSAASASGLITTTGPSPWPTPPQPPPQFHDLLSPSVAGEEEEGRLNGHSLVSVADTKGSSSSSSGGGGGGGGGSKKKKKGNSSSSSKKKKRAGGADPSSSSSVSALEDEACPGCPQASRDVIHLYRVLLFQFTERDHDDDDDDDSDDSDDDSESHDESEEDEGDDDDEGSVAGNGGGGSSKGVTAKELSERRRRADLKLSDKRRAAEAKTNGGSKKKKGGRGKATAAAAAAGQSAEMPTVSGAERVKQFLERTVGTGSGSGLLFLLRFIEAVEEFKALPQDNRCVHLEPRHFTSPSLIFAPSV